MKVKMLFIFGVLALAIHANSVLCAQATENAIEQTPKAALQQISLETEPIGPGDLLDIAVWDCPELSRSYRVGQNGGLSLPVLQKPLEVNGLRVTEVEDQLRGALVAAHVLVRPRVAVSILEYRSRPVTVAGAVKHPVTVQAIGGMRLLDAIAKADGLSTDAGTEILLSSRTSNGPNDQISRIPLKELINHPSSPLNVVLQGGEQIQIPPAEHFFVMGNVKAPGSFPLTDPDGFSVLKAMALCQGELAFSQPEAVIYRLNENGGARREISIPLKSILKRQSPDVALQANDILYVLDDSGKRNTARVLDRLSGFATTTGSGLLVWGR